MGKRKYTVPRALSWWEIAEAYVDARNGVSIQSLAQRYGCTEMRLVRWFDRFEDEALKRGLRVEPFDINRTVDNDVKYAAEYRVLLEGDSSYGSDGFN